MSDENDSWLEGIGVSIEKFFSSDSDQGGVCVAPAPAQTDSGGPSDGKPTLPTAPVSPDADPSGSSKDPRAFQSDFDRGYADGRDGRESNPTPASGDALDAYEKGYAQGHAEYLKKEDVTKEYNRGFQDGKDGKPSSAGPLAPEFLAEYERGYAEGTAQQDASDFGPDKPIIWLTIRGVVWGITKILDIGGGVFRYIVVSVGGMKCDSPHFRFKCPTCGEEGDLKCTAEEAADDRKQHKEKFPDHMPTSTPPDSWSGDPP